MAEDTAVTSKAGAESPSSSQAPGDSPGQKGAPAKPTTTRSAPAASPPAPVVPNFPPPKTDKPRPHVCLTCTRSFARLEHLKRHERSHTKEKPFECQSCTRCFARRDLLLRHQQKLHSTTTPSSRPRNGRRESAAGVAGSRVRKNSMVSTQNQTMRPRANTLSHVDASTLGMMSGSAFNRSFVPMHSHHNSFSTMSSMGNLGLRGMGMSNSASMMGLPRLDTNSVASHVSNGLRTAPPFGGFPADFDLEMMSYDTGHSHTINPHELHTPSLQGLGIDGSADYGDGHYSGMPNSQAIVDEDAGFDWMAHGFEQQMSFMGAENAIESSPSAMDTNSPATFPDAAAHRSGSQVAQGQSKMDHMWQLPATTQQHSINSPMSMDIQALFADMPPSAESTISPKSLLAQNNAGFDMYFATPPELSTMDTSNMSTMSNGPFPLPFKHENVPSTASTASIDSSMRHSSITTNFGDLVTEQLRNSVIASLSQFTGFGQRRQSAPVVSSPLTPGGSTKAKVFNANTFPTTLDLQRYASAYFRFCHPHLPFLHLPTLNFESPEYSTSHRSAGPYAHYGAANNAIGGSCLLLSIVAMGALYENEASVSRELFEYAKRMISNYLEGRRKTNANRSLFASHHNMDSEDTPLWLVQAMLLNVVYGHNCGDKTAADIASNHCAALVSLARGAELAKPYPSFVNTDAWAGPGQDNGDVEWLEWKILEERKRTLYSIFVLSSMLVMAYNRAPALTNSEIRLDLPCDEELWAAESAHAWRAFGGMAAVKSRSIPFAGALTHLLTAAQREKQAAEQNFGTDGWHQEAPNSVLKPSSFGCLVLIDALHNYIWETRQRHLGRQWTPQEVEAMHAHIEPALRAWSTAWSSNPLHVIERPNPFGAGPLPADSIPLLDLAYVRLFVDFGRSKEAYWQRDYDSMAQELAKGPETGYNGSMGSHGAASSSSPQINRNGAHVDALNVESPEDGMEMLQGSNSRPSRRERHLRKAAFYAADHLFNADRLGVAFAEKTSRDLPMQSILCACDSAQVLSEWVTALQERVGRYVGVIGRDEINLNEVPAVLMLDEEDRTLLARVDGLLNSSEQKSDNKAALFEARKGGYGSRILVQTSQTMARAAVWPVTRLMSQSLEIQAGHVTARVRASVAQQQVSQAA
ncbi:hypothetical protein PMZ80_009323 [Knufia obscura]|uniref:C2H2-type domain-containing protein n=1 Tax=Knufia obscura TaxID=1635080 RepID=A0ABR0RCJ3_9EURO|nr:hypothetical protein PMZ80_009323 [Knufia obscura]